MTRNMAAVWPSMAGYDLDELEAGTKTEEERRVIEWRRGFDAAGFGYAARLNYEAFRDREMGHV